MARTWAACGLLMVATGCAPESPPPTQRDALPPLVDLDGRPLAPLGQTGVKAVAMIFVLPDCPIANSYLPEINRLYSKFRSQGVELLVVQADPATTAEQARQHRAEYEIAAPVALDADQAWVRRGGAKRTPEAVVFSPAGEILYRGRIDDRYVGLGQKRPEAQQHNLRDALEAIVAGRSVKEPRTEAVGCYIPELRKGK